MVKEYFLVYLIYGFAMINMGIFCLKEKVDYLSSLSLLRSLKYLGWFGIIHGLSEWITVVIIANLYPEYNQHLFNIAQILKALSFALLMYFGFDLYPIENRYKRVMKLVPIVLFASYFLGFVILIESNGINYHNLNPKFSVFAMRYSLGLSSGIISANALLLNSKKVEKQQSKKISKRYRQLAWVILINSLLEGLLVKRYNFFPANIINRDIFYNIFNIETLFFKALIGLLINYLLVKVIDTFSWEQEEHLKRLEVHKIKSEERRRLSLEIHDSIIQSLYAVGLKLEFLIMNKDNNVTSERLNDIKNDLNNTIYKTRELMTSTALDVIEIDDLNNKIEQIIKRYSDYQNIKFNFKSEISPVMSGVLSPEESTQIFYIIQEAICNVIKHSKATRADVILEAKYDLINISVIDNGIGIKQEDLYKDKHFGIESMKDRTEGMGGKFKIKNLKNGLKVNIELPWEVKNE
ncbi:MAG: sensor histidine kinase [Tissierellaceae bacterium]|nr:sensor histidine kinase [Tissierellaceae bacterium]